MFSVQAATEKVKKNGPKIFRMEREFVSQQKYKITF